MRRIRLLAEQISNVVCAASLPADPEQHICREQQHCYLPRAHRHNESANEQQQQQTTTVPSFYPTATAAAAASANSAYCCPVPWVSKVLFEEASSTRSYPPATSETDSAEDRAEIDQEIKGMK